MSCCVIAKHDWHIGGVGPPLITLNGGGKGSEGRCVLLNDELVREAVS